MAVVISSYCIKYFPIEGTQKTRSVFGRSSCSTSPPDLRASAPSGLLGIMEQESFADMSVDDSHPASQPLLSQPLLSPIKQDFQYFRQEGISHNNSLGFESQETDPSFVTQDTGYHTNSLQLTNQENTQSAHTSQESPHTNLTNQFGNLPLEEHDTGYDPDFGTDSSGSFLVHEAYSAGQALFKQSKTFGNRKMAPPSVPMEQDALGGQYFDRDLLRSVKQSRSVPCNLNTKDQGKGKCNAAKQLCLDFTKLDNAAGDIS